MVVVSVNNSVVNGFMSWMTQVALKVFSSLIVRELYQEISLNSTASFQLAGRSGKSFFNLGRYDAVIFPGNCMRIHPCLLCGTSSTLMKFFIAALSKLRSLQCVISLLSLKVNLKLFITSLLHFSTVCFLGSL